MTTKKGLDLKRSVRIRIKPKITDPTYILTKANVSVFKESIMNSDFKKVLDVGCEYKPFKTFLKMLNMLE